MLNGNAIGHKHDFDFGKFDFTDLQYQWIFLLVVRIRDLYL